MTIIGAPAETCSRLASFAERLAQLQLALRDSTDVEKIIHQMNKVLELTFNHRARLLEDRRLFGKPHDLHGGPLLAGTEECPASFRAAAIFRKDLPPAFRL